MPHPLRHGTTRAYTRIMPTQCYCFALRAAARKATALYDAALAPVGVSVAQFSLLRNIERAAPLSMTELGRLVDLDRSTIGRNIRVLQRMGLVQVTPGTDQREATLTLTDAARDVIRRAAPLWDDAQRGIEASLGRATAAHLRTLLQSL